MFSSVMRDKDNFLGSELAVLSSV
uniref:Uncharacterized protein n=1 Tax=Arundo donax TaxID=35708 RepID=A0A0A9FM71_ARUDO